MRRATQPTWPGVALLGAVAFAGAGVVGLDMILGGGDLTASTRAALAVGICVGTVAGIGVFVWAVFRFQRAGITAPSRRIVWASVVLVVVLLVLMQGPVEVQTVTWGSVCTFMVALLGLGSAWAYRHRNDWRNIETPSDEPGETRSM
jgi:hypothetical protein